MSQGDEHQFSFGLINRPEDFEEEKHLRNQQDMSVPDNITYLDNGSRLEASENFVIEPTLDDSLEETQFNCIAF